MAHNRMVYDFVVRVPIRMHDPSKAPELLREIRLILVNEINWDAFGAEVPVEIHVETESR